MKFSFLDRYARVGKELGMTLDELQASLADPGPPPGLPPLVRALWLERHGDWDGAHAIAQDDESPNGAWVHAYLHRREGDQGNAAYWYGRASRSPQSGGLAEEWELIARTLLGVG